MGVLMLLSGIELGYTPLEASITVSVLLGLMTLIVGVAVSYLALADGGALGNIEDLLTPELAMEPAGDGAVAQGDADEDDN